MELTLSHEQTKTMLKNIMIEMMTEQKYLFYHVILEAMEEVAMAHAIIEG